MKGSTSKLGQATDIMHSWLRGLLVSFAVSSILFYTADGLRAARVTSRITLQDGKWTARIISTPLRQVLREVSRLTGAEILWLNLEENEVVSVEFIDATIQRALRKILGQRNFMLFYSPPEEGGKLTEIWISSGGNRQIEQPAPARASTSVLWRTRRTALRGQDLSSRLQAVEQLKRYAQTNKLAKRMLDYVARQADDPHVRYAAAQALAQVQ
jgi:hypothetical protein